MKKRRGNKRTKEIKPIIKEFVGWVVVVVVLVVCGLLVVDRFRTLAKECDQARGHRCSLYEIEEHSR